MSDTPVLVALAPGGHALARRIAKALPGAEIHGLAGRTEGAEATFTGTTEHLRALFQAGRPIVGLCAPGIPLRALGPLLQDKREEPPVVAVAEDGSAVVPLLGGHRGANDLARTIAGVLDITPAITTAGDARFGVALDAPPPGWRLANPEHHKGFMASLLGGAGVRLEGTAPWLAASGLPVDPEAELVIRVTEQADNGSDHRLVYHAAVLALGVGCERGAAPEEVLDLARQTLRDHGLAEAAVAGVYSLDLKADEPAVHAVAAALGVAARFFDAAALEAETPRLATPSDLVFREVGCHGVAEGAALAAAGPEAALVVAKAKSARATCAVAKAPDPLGAAGRPRGSLAVVGIGPGDPLWRTPEAAAAVRDATDLVGYGLYLDLLGPLAQGKTRHDYQLGEETVRVRAALDLAAEGRSVALVCSGDPGIYAMAALVFELLERENKLAWRRPAVTVVPGISALQAAAARIGAPLGHDFCAISLSDLLTPWPVIERRLEAAAQGDFVVALYNPVSKRRRHQLAAAARILRAHRPADTPVVLARNLGRDGEAVAVIALDELSPERVDMLTLVLVGSSETRRVARGDGGAWVYTPRGYAAKGPDAEEVA
ncbi:MAG: precorrin-3B C(17)-methyltransferase [Rhodospirillales bacterium]|nr:precorrin-3B C(17)-methyltransferase [Rhodospirillales bacterium]